MSPLGDELTERFVQMFQGVMKASEHDGSSLQHRLSNFLLTYRSPPHAKTYESPSSLLLKREVRTQLNLLKPDGRT